MMRRAFSSRYLSFALSFVIISILLLVFLPKLGREIERSEQSRFDFRIEELRAAIYFQQLTLHSRSELSKAHRLKGANPYQWLRGRVAEQPSFYVGETEDLSTVPVANWAYDPERKVLLYRIEDFVVLDEKQYAAPNWLVFAVTTQIAEEKVQALSLRFLGAFEPQITADEKK